VGGESTPSRSLFQYLTTCILKRFFLISDRDLLCFNFCPLPLGRLLLTSGRSLLLGSRLLLAHHILQHRNHSWLLIFLELGSPALDTALQMGPKLAGLTPSPLVGWGWPRTCAGWVGVLWRRLPKAARLVLPAWLNKIGREQPELSPPLLFF